MKRILLAVLVALGLQTQAQISPCDSVEYSIISSSNSIVLQLEGWVNGICPTNFPCVVSSWNWQVCNDSLCGGDTAQTVYFPNTFCTFTTADTLNLCLTTTMTIDTMTYTCIQCDTLVYGPNGWMLMSMGNPTSINELELNTINSGKVFDIMGREVFNLNTGVMYIRNNKKFIIIK
jgi:hypothetical protein